MREKLKNCYHKFDLYDSNDKYEIKLTNIIFMFIIFILVAVCMFIFHPKEVKAETIPQPNHYSVYKPNGNVNTYSIRLMPQWWWGYNQYVGAASDASLIITPEVKQEFVWSNFRQYCSDTLIINGSITSVNFSANYDKFNIYINNGSKSNLCSKSYDVSAHLVNFSCPLTMSSINSVSISINSNVPAVEFNGGFGLLSNSTYSCTINSSDIINNQNNNTQTIINNNNNNTNQIINNQNQNADKINDSINDVNNSITDSSTDNPSSSFDSFNDKIATNGVITDLITLHIKLFTNVLNNINGTCKTFNIGNLFGANLSFPCIDLSKYFGSTLWNVIDVLFSGFFVLIISKKMIKVFENFSSMREGDVLSD